MASPQGALGNAPLGTSPCRCGGGFLRVCIPCNGFRHRVSPDLSSDKSPLVGDPSDTMLEELMGGGGTIKYFN
ncbi:hypothetical protein OUZ56_006994 [Daphnia magna]|uniref:Uncharacterized protein n=1 Tax=Daphnia magna TaxID=35525 RepID=A0ABQ9YXA1_9CRUS|nr:hypothetical protein OUZ56_006994 [Daphnia magna]